MHFPHLSVRLLFNFLRRRPQPSSPTAATPSSASVEGSGTTLSTTSSPWTAMFAGRPSIVPLVLVPRLPIGTDPESIKLYVPGAKLFVQMKLKSVNCWLLRTKLPQAIVPLVKGVSSSEIQRRARRQNQAAAHGQSAQRITRRQGAARGHGHAGQAARAAEHAASVDRDRADEQAVDEEFALVDRRWAGVGVGPRKRQHAAALLDQRSAAAADRAVKRGSRRLIDPQRPAAQQHPAAQAVGRGERGDRLRAARHVQGAAVADRQRRIHRQVVGCGLLARRRPADAPLDMSK